MFKSIRVSLTGVMIAASLCLYMVALTSAQEKVSGEQGRGYSNNATIFVKGHYAYVIDIGITTPNGLLDSCWLRIIDVQYPSQIHTCYSQYLKAAKEAFVAGNYLYVARQTGFSGYVILLKYDITSPCNPRLVDSVNTYTNCLWVTDMFINGDKAYLSMDPYGVLVFDVPDSSIGDEFDFWYSAGGHSPSVQGIHQRGYAYMAAEALGLWIHNIATGTDYLIAGSGCSYDVFNVGSSAATTNLTYEATVDSFRVWNTSNPANVTLVGSNGYGGSTYQVVHVTGDWVYRMGNGVEAYKVQYGLPAPKLYTPPGLLYDIHEVHSCYSGPPPIPIYGQAHIYGVYNNADTVAIWRYDPFFKVQLVPRYKYGDVNKDGIVNVSDVVAILNYVQLNASITSLDAADVNCDGEVNSYDAAYLINYLFNSGPAPGVDCDFYH